MVFSVRGGFDSLEGRVWHKEVKRKEHFLMLVFMPWNKELCLNVTPGRIRVIPKVGRY